jgi:hypothetical protein
MNNQGIRKINFTPKGLERVRRAVEGFETAPQSEGKEIPGADRVPHALKVKTPSGGISAASSATTPSSAVCTLQNWSGTAWVNGTGSLKVYNPSTAAAIPGSTLISILYVNGIWEANVVPCS